MFSDPRSNRSGFLRRQDVMHEDVITGNPCVRIIIDFSALNLFEQEYQCTFVPVVCRDYFSIPASATEIMVSITKSTNNVNGLLLLNKKTATAASLTLVIFVFVSILWLSCLVSVVILVPSPPSPVGGRPSSSSSSSIETLANSVLMRLDRLSHSVPISSSSSSSSENDPSDGQRPSRLGAGARRIDVLDEDDASPEAIFLAASMKECLPGRDDVSGQINPTTHKERECLRHVPDKRKRSGNDNDGSLGGGGNGNGGLTDADVGVDGTASRRTRPRIGIMIPPGLIGRSFGDWIAGALKIDDDIEIVITSHVPVYGYGKSHGYTKLVRLVTLPLAVAAYDAYRSIASSSSSSGDGVHIDGGSSSSSSSLLRGRSESDGVSRDSPLLFSTPTIATIGTMVRLVMRWHCRLSREYYFRVIVIICPPPPPSYSVRVHASPYASLPHPALFYVCACAGRGAFSFVAVGDGTDVSAHTAMVTVSLEDVLKDPAGALDKVLTFIRRDDWEWKNRETLPEKEEDKKRGAVDDRLVVNRDELLRALLDRASLVVDGASSLYVDAYRKSIRDAFSYEMEMSSDMSAWPCPSFWEGVDGRPGTNSDNKDGQTLILRRISEEMVPNCSDDDPYARCTVNKDRCEMRGDAKCN